MAEVVKQQQDSVAAIASDTERKDASGPAAIVQPGEATPEKTLSKAPAPVASSTSGEGPSVKAAEAKPGAAEKATDARRPLAKAALAKTGKQPAAKAGRTQPSAKSAPAQAGASCAGGRKAGSHADGQADQKASAKHNASGGSVEKRAADGDMSGKPNQAAAATSGKAVARRAVSAKSAPAAHNPAQADVADAAVSDDVLAETLRHGAQVARLTAALFDQLQDLHGLDADWRRRLLEAARLHDIGFVAGRKGHHKASMRKILEDTALNLSSEDRPLIALLARYHRKAWPSSRHSQFAALPRTTRKALRRAAALLRVADGLDYTHQGLVTEVTAKLKSRRVILLLRSAAECPQEMKRAVRKGDLFAHVFGLQVECACQPD